jgi:peptide/nickel transport system substrate-binding protein
MKLRHLTAQTALLSALFFAAGPASAQKSEDTIRLAINDPFNTIDSYTIGHEESNTFIRVLYQHLISFDEYKKTWVPVLAKSFRRVDDKTLEFDLREGIKFHNGNPFNADDVKYMIEYLIDPNSKVMFKDRYGWIKNVEILNPYKIRIHQNYSFSTDLGTLAYRIRMYDKETLEALADKSDYGHTAIGTGPYRLVSLDRNKGALVERTTNQFPDLPYFKAPVKRVQGVFLPDKQTRIAQLMTGGIDLMRNIGPDEAQALAANPNLGVTATSSATILYVTLDAIGRSDNKIMMDERVRKAFIMAIDREKLVRALVPGGNKAYIMKSICLPSMLGCAPSTDPVKYDPAAAKRLLAEAGYPDGFDLQIDAFEPVKYMAEAIAGEVRKIGIRASVQPLTSTVYVKKRGDGEFTAFVGNYPTGTHPDVATMWDFFFAGNRDYWKDSFIEKVYAAGNKEFDDAKRTAIYTPGLNRINEKAYILPISEMPMLWAHGKDVIVSENTMSASSPVLGDFAFKK